MENLILKLPWSGSGNADPELLLTREWLVTNGLGGYASGTLAGAITRRYHGLLIAALPAPLGRRVMLSHLSELVRLPDGTILRFSGEERLDGILELHGIEYLTEFRLDAGLPVWRYEVGGFVIEKRIFLPHMQNTVYIHYSLISGDGTIRLKLRPSVHFRSHDAPVSELPAEPYTLTAVEDRYELAENAQTPPLRMKLYGQRGAFTLDGKKLQNIFYRVEARRGYEATGDLWSPGYFRVDLTKDQPATLVASTGAWETIFALKPEEALEAEYERRRRLISMAHPKAQTGLAGELVFAADQFIITPAGRIEDAARARASGDEVRTIIAGYHWFTDWGRDTMISLEGLTLTTGRHLEAGYILRTFSHYIRDGLIPNLFPEGEKEGLYHTADATLWFFHALDRYLEVTNDYETLTLILPKLLDIVEHHLRGTRFGIHVDPKDGLLSQGQEGYQLTWMDAKVGDWVVTPRRGKAVEINALWYNALRLLEEWTRKGLGEEVAHSLAQHAEQAYRSFNQRFWYEKGGYLYDVVDGEQGDDPACRPNQIFAISLRHPILDPAKWKPVLEVVQKRLLTPVGLRSLAPDHPDYKPTYDGDLRARDAAYHQGTVWAWLIGPFVDAWLKVYPEDRKGARRFLQGFMPHLREACIGSISEIFDAEPPFTPRGCVAQAWSVAEVLRCWVKTTE
ncbi:MAG TPA: amylo-alpha-1,6-glucosidase [Candidatus Limnocylindrales bacterium]|nr:amylo-alpha-1,6-glucosidase [Candidatus Limnocylindrales bacterium]